MDKLTFKQKFNLSEKQQENFQTFCDYLLENNKKFNLTAIRDQNEVYLKHFADSLSGFNYFSEDAKILEIGSGGGFPSVPLKIFNPNLNLTLVEATGKKCVFLNGVKSLFNFKNFEVINARCEELVLKGYREKFDIVTARAVASLNVLCELCAPFLKVGGKCVFYKNVSESELNLAKNALLKLGLKVAKIIPYSLNGENPERCIMILQKHKQTPDNYPREYKQILKKPL